MFLNGSFRSQILNDVISVNLPVCFFMHKLNTNINTTIKLGTGSLIRVMFSHKCNTWG